MRRFILALTTIAVVATFALGTSGSSQTGGPPTGARDLARRLLTQPGARFSAMGELGLRTIAAGGHMWQPGDQGLQPDAAAAGTGGLTARKTPPTLANVRVNDPAADTHGEDQTTQSETSIAVSGSNVAVGYNDSQRTGLFLTAGSSLSGYSYSTDSGAHFADGGALPNRAGFVNAGDPWLANDRHGTMYYSNLMFGVFDGELGTSTSTDGGRTWTAPVAVLRRPPLYQFYFADKDAMTVGPDPSRPNRDDVYVAWDDFTFAPRHFYTGLAISHSYDGGKTWTQVYADKVDNIHGCSFVQYFGAQPVVDPSDGILYLEAEKISVDDPNCNGAPTVFSEVMFKSTDGGKTFGPGVQIAQLPLSTLDTIGLKLGPGKVMRLADFPTVAILSNTVYVAWNQRGPDHTHIVMASSTDGGETWSLSNATTGFGDEVQPALSADASGLHLLYYELNSNDTLDVYVANSADGSQFIPRLVTTKAFPGALTFPQFDPIIAYGYMGDYIANVSDGSNQYFAWGDNRDKVTDFLYPSGRADPDVFFAKQ